MARTGRISDRRGMSSTAAVCMAALLVSAACGGGHELQRYSFAGTTLAAVDYEPPAPELWTGAYDVEGEDVFRTVLDASSRVAREVEARRARTRLDSAAVLVDVRRQMSTRTLERAGRYLGASQVDNAASADYLLEIQVRRFGIDARDDRPAKVFMDVEAVLISRASGHEVWSVEVETHDRITPAVRGGGVPSDIVTAASLYTLTVEDYRRALDGLTDFTSDYVSNELRKDLRDLRRD